ncbi:MAG: hypothetical protein A3E01_06575 [Gammaproteobacteria bacterium RIFCSPHIGHO2_12_FULL_63_22]|nr:MAG: hypothetical protein A3E01_06575 [Gammaproteobacteria bacterium RIFCSPHIGHO2_12_FULL_63_22]
MSLEAITKALEAIDDLHDRRVNGFASIEHEGQLMDAAGPLAAALRVAVADYQKMIDNPYCGEGAGWAYADVAKEMLGKIASLLEGSR